jgi:hypothetical protein
MSNFKKFVAGFATVAMAVSMFAFAPVSQAATAGEVYVDQNGTVWFITSDMQKRPFTSEGAFRSYGFLSFSQVKPISSDPSVAALPNGAFIPPQDGRIFCATATKGTDVAGECSLITGGKKAAFTSQAVFTGQGYSFSRAFYGDSSFLEKTTNIDNASAQHRPGTLINNNGTVQLVVNGGLWGVPSMDVFNSWGWSFADVVPANAADLLLSQIGVIPARQAGQLVPTGTTNPGNPGTPGAGDCNLDGVAGDVTITLENEYSAEEVGEGDEETPVMDFDVEADNDSDVEVTSVNIELEQTNAADSEDITDYIDEVVIMVDGEVVGSADAEDFNEEDDRYSKSISLDDCVVIDAGETETFVVAISANESLDSADIDSDVWDVELASLRFVDGDGVTTTETPAADAIDRSFDFGTFAAVNDVELTVSLSEDGEDVNEARIIDVDDTEDTEEVEILNFTLEATGDSDITVTEIPVTITTTGETDQAVLLINAHLMMDGEIIATEDVPTGGVVTFEDLDIEIDADDEVELTLAVDIQDVDGAADSGDTVQASLTTGNVDAIEAEDASGEDVATTDLEGSAVGETHTIFEEGIMTEFVSASETRTVVADAAGEFDQGEFKITFEVTAFDGDMRIDRSCEEAGADAAGQGVEYTITNSGSNATTCLLSSSTSDSEDTANTFEVDEGTTRTFTLTVTATASADHYAEVSLSSINWGTATDDTNANYYTYNLEDYKTDAMFLNAF